MAASSCHQENGQLGLAADKIASSVRGSFSSLRSFQEKHEDIEGLSSWVLASGSPRFEKDRIHEISALSANGWDKLFVDVSGGISPLDADARCDLPVPSPRSSFSEISPLFKSGIAHPDFPSVENPTAPDLSRPNEAAPPSSSNPSGNSSSFSTDPKILGKRKERSASFPTLPIPSPRSLYGEEFKNRDIARLPDEAGADFRITSGISTNPSDSRSGSADSSNMPSRASARLRERAEKVAKTDLSFLKGGLSAMPFSPERQQGERTEMQTDGLSVPSSSQTSATVTVPQFQDTPSASPHIVEGHPGVAHSVLDAPALEREPEAERTTRPAIKQRDPTTREEDLEEWIIKAALDDSRSAREWFNEYERSVDDPYRYSRFCDRAKAKRASLGRPPRQRGRRKVLNLKKLEQWITKAARDDRRSATEWYDEYRRSVKTPCCHSTFYEEEKKKRASLGRPARPLERPRASAPQQ